MTVRLQTNVLCVGALSERQIATKLNYFHLVELSHVNPIRFPYMLHSRENLTQKQELQKVTFLRERMTHLWDVNPGLAPLPGSRIKNPFKVEIAERQEVEPKSAKTKAAKSKPESAPVATATKKQTAPKEDEHVTVVGAASDADIFVIAPPGTGKTHVLVERIAHLITGGHCKSPSEEMLVLSFTRSAVSEVRRRLLAKIEQGGHPDVLYARVLTFDSLATRAIMLDREPEFLAGMDYSERIRLFGELVGTRLPNALAQLQKVRYLFVDEVQDLSGHRATMVLSIARIVKEAGGAVWFLGDPAQAIYDFDEEASEILASEAFLRQLSEGSYCARPPHEVRFENYRRFETPEMLTFVTRARGAMGETGLEPDGGQLAALLSELGERHRTDQLLEWAQGSGSKAILARTNLEAYQIWAYCDREEINAELWRGSSGSYWPGWIGRLVMGFRQETMPLSKLEERWRDAVGSVARLTLKDAIGTLEREGVLSEGRLDLWRLNQLVASGSPTVPRKQSTSVTISTIHRSKGLEFDEVLLYSPNDNFAGEASDVRVLYVAATRAKRKFRLLDRSDVVRRGARNSAWMNLRTQHFHVRLPNGMGLLLDGVDEADARSWLDADPESVTEDAAYIWQQGGSQIPRPLEIRDGQGPVPDIVLGERRIGSVAVAVHRDLQRISRWQSSRFDRCAGYNMVDVATIALDPEDPRARAAFGVACLAITPVISGIGTVRTRKA